MLTQAHLGGAARDARRRDRKNHFLHLPCDIARTRHTDAYSTHHHIPTIAPPPHPHSPTVMSATAGPMSSAPAHGMPGQVPRQQNSFKAQDKPDEVRRSNISAARAVSDAIRTSLGPKGMDKMIQTPQGEVVITNDGATILKHMAVMHPAARMLVELSQAQDVEAGDGTTSVVVVAGSLLGAAEKMLNKGIHPTIIAESFQRAATKAVQYLEEISTPVDLADKESLLRAASTSLNSKIVSQYSSVLAPIAVRAVTRLLDPAASAVAPSKSSADASSASAPGGSAAAPSSKAALSGQDSSSSASVDLRDIRIVKKVGGTIDDTELIEGGLVLEQNVVTGSGGPSRMEKAKIAVCQFQLSSPKPDVSRREHSRSDQPLMIRIVQPNDDPSPHSTDGQPDCGQ